jgi:dTDP-4-dehydrorhamnose reductase
MKIAVNGSTGQIASQLPFDYTNINSRLEDSHKSIKENFNIIRPDCFIHFAAMTDVKKCENQKYLANYLNNVCAVKYFNIASKLQVSRFIFISTSHVYEPTNSLKCLDVTDSKIPSSYYGLTKLRAENNLIAAAQHSNTRLVIARLFSVVSQEPRKGSLMYGIQKRVRDRDFSPIPGLNKVRDFITINYLSSKIMELAMMDLPPSIVNICSGKPKSVRSIVEEEFTKLNIDIGNIDGQDMDQDYLVGLPTKF